MALGIIFCRGWKAIGGFEQSNDNDLNYAAKALPWLLF